MSPAPLQFGLTSALTLALAATAFAGVPHPSTRLIVPGKSLGGVRLGGTFAAARKAWGPGADCRKNFSMRVCVYKTNSYADGSAGFSSRSGGRIDEITLNAGFTRNSTPIFTNSVARFRTSKGIRLGSTSAAVRKAYPDVKRRSGSASYPLVLSGPGEATTTFQISRRRVIGIRIASASP
jgi:hypothetical protein